MHANSIMFSYSWSVLLPLIIFLVTLSLLQLVYSQCQVSDRDTLLKIKSDFGNPPSLDSWKNTTDCCISWDGVTCDVSTYKITQLYITNTNFSGQIPPSIGDLPDLKHLKIDNHSRLIGPIPEAITKLHSLQHLILTWTLISGPIPNFLCNLTNLEEINLSGNRFSGSIPKCFPPLVHIIDFSLNRLTGQIPNSLLGGWPGNDTFLSLAHNKITGKIPQSFATINFQNIDLTDNQMQGDASLLFGESKLTTQIKLGNNKFNFDLSSVTYPLNLKVLAVSHNKIRGSINQQITKLQALWDQNFSFNRLCGAIPTGGPIMRWLEASSFIHNKCLCGTPLPPC